ncbi:hypothetical protein HMPREF1548_01429 [Clostridium sp. KLE 1755]|nr:hypothetical protein HMPREF1548_01429 [Clostridium sp. KLE 1755]
MYGEIFFHHIRQSSRCVVFKHRQKRKTAPGRLNLNKWRVHYGE